MMYNEPGLHEISYRSGLHADFFARMIKSLGDEAYPALHDLSTREATDLTMGLLDACASLGDVLTFYQERIANEHYLGTAVERLSIRELSTLVNYRFSPGKAADVYVAFELDTAAGSPLEVPLTAGIKVESVPGPDELLEPFETIEDFVARPEWNVIRPRMSRPVSIEEVAENEWALLEGTGLAIDVGDRLMLAVEDDESGDRELKIVSAVVEDTVTNTTSIEFGKPVQLPFWETLFVATVFHSPVATLSVADEPFDTAWIGQNVQSTVWHQADIVTQAGMWGYNTQYMTNVFAAQSFPLLAPGTPVPVVDGLSVFRTAAAVFGHDANPITQAPPPDSTVMPAADQPDDVAKEIVSGLLPLAAEHKTIPADSVVAFETTGKSAAFHTVTGVESASVNRYQRSARVSQLQLILPFDHDLATRSTRSTTVHAEPEPLPLAELPVVDDVTGDTVVLERAYLDLQIGQAVAFTGERVDLAGATVTEVRTIKQLLLASGVTVVTFDVPLEFNYRRETVIIRANLVRATHGERVERVLGSGNATERFQSFVLPDVPLTYVGANTPTNVASTLEVRVDGVLWTERDELATAGPDERVYMVRTREMARVG